MWPRTCEHGNAFTGAGRLQTGDQVRDSFGLGLGTAVVLDPIHHRLTFDIRPPGDTRQVRHRAAAHVVGAREDARESLIAPMHQRRRGPEIPAQRQRLEMQLVETGGAHGGEAPHLGIAKSVDRLHRIAHQEQRATVAVAPVPGQRDQQFILIARSVLELIDEDVFEVHADALGQGRRVAVLRQRLPRRAGDLGVVAFAVLVEQHPQHRRCLKQQA